MEQVSLPDHVSIPLPLNQIALAGNVAGPLKRKVAEELGDAECGLLSPRHPRPSRLRMDADILPIDHAKSDILEMIRGSEVTFILAETGSGKTTRVPQYVLDDCLQRGESCRIVVTQLRRIAAISSAHRVATERCENLQNTQSGQTSVGYAVKGDACWPHSSGSIVYMTEQKLLSSLRSSALARFSHLLIDEAQERTEFMDTLLMLWRTLLQEHRPRPKLVLMTANVGVQSLQSFFEVDQSRAITRKITVQGRCYRVERVFLDSIPDVQHRFGDAPELAVEKAVGWLFRTRGPGVVLVFLADLKEMDACAKSLSGVAGCMVCKLHAKSSTYDKGLALTPSTEYHRLILATNVAETTLTIPDVSYVIDFLTERLPPLLAKVPISKASQSQRQGRAGRCRDGTCLVMASQQFYDELSDMRTPATQRLPLHRLLLFALTNGLISNTSSSMSVLGRLPAPPDPESVKHRTEELELMELTIGGDLTLLGETVATIPYELEVAVALMSGAFLGVGSQLALVLAVVKSTSFMEQFAAQHDAASCMCAWQGEEVKSELFAAASWLEWYLAGRVQWHGSDSALEGVITTLRDLESELRLLPDITPSHGWLEDVWPSVEFAFVSGYRLCLASPHGAGKFRARDGWSYKISKHSLLQPSMTSLVCYTSNVGFFLRGVSSVSVLSAIAFGGRCIRKDDKYVLLNDSVEMEWHGQWHDALLSLRITFASLLSAYLERRSEHASAYMSLRRFLAWNHTPALCRPFRRMAQVTGNQLNQPVSLVDQPASELVQPASPASLLVPPTSLASAAIQPNQRAQPADSAQSTSREAMQDVSSESDGLHATARLNCCTLPPISALGPCSKGGRHKVAKSRRDVAEYQFFAAASEGCLVCVRQELEVLQRISPDVTSQSNKYTVRDFTDWAAKQSGGAGVMAVKTYLDEHWSHIPVQHA